MSARLTFCSGAGTVTGANFLFETGSKKILVDCGALERERVCDPANLRDFPYDPRSIDALIVTHAHQDHIGRIPKLVRDGFRGVIYSTPATKDLSVLMFADSLGVMEREMKQYGCGVLYEKEDVARALSLWQTHEYHEKFKIGDSGVEFLDAGHILGSAMAKLTRNERTILFTGDLGNSPEPLLNDCESPAGANYIVMESVYGDRLHEDRGQRRQILKMAVEDVRGRRGTLLIPSFSIERTQVLLYELNEMIEKKEIAPIPVYLDAPLAIRVTGVFEKYKNELKEAAREEFARGRDPFAFPGLVQTPTVSESREIYAASDPKIIIAGAGMSSGGRVRAHEKRYLSDPHAVLLLVGYQAPGSLGRRIQDGEKSVAIDGEQVRVQAKIETLTGYSGHADRDQLLDFVEKAATTVEDGSPNAPQGGAFRGESLEKAFVVMGEPKASGFLAQRIQDFLGVKALAPNAGESAAIDW